MARALAKPYLHIMPDTFRFLLIPAAALALAGCADDARDERPVTEPVEQTQSAPAAVGERPVQIGFDGPRFSACASFGRVINLDAGGDEALPVRIAPTRTAEESDMLAPGRRVAMCQKVGDWIGVVYPPEAEEPVDCGTRARVSGARAYDGPCRSGWVNENYIRLVPGT